MSSRQHLRASCVDAPAAGGRAPAPRRRAARRRCGGSARPHRVSPGWRRGACGARPLPLRCPRCPGAARRAGAGPVQGRSACGGAHVRCGPGSDAGGSPGTESWRPGDQRFPPAGRDVGDGSVPVAGAREPVGEPRQSARRRSACAAWCPRWWTAFVSWACSPGGGADIPKRPQAGKRCRPSAVSRLNGGSVEDVSRGRGWRAGSAERGRGTDALVFADARTRRRWVSRPSWATPPLPEVEVPVRAVVMMTRRRFGSAAVGVALPAPNVWSRLGLMPCWAR